MSAQIDYVTINRSDGSFMKKILTIALVFAILSGTVTAMAGSTATMVSVWAEEEVQMAQVYGLAEWVDADMDLRKEITQREWVELLAALCGKLSGNETSASEFGDNDSIAPVNRGTAILSLYDLIQRVFPDKSTTPINLLFEDDALFINDNVRYAASFLYLFDILSGVGSTSEAEIGVVAARIQPERNIMREEALALAVRVYEERDVLAVLSTEKKGWGIVEDDTVRPGYEAIEAFLRDNFEAFEEAKNIAEKYRFIYIRVEGNVVRYSLDTGEKPSEEYNKKLLRFMHIHNIFAIERYSYPVRFSAEYFCYEGVSDFSDSIDYDANGSGIYGLPEHLLNSGYKGAWDNFTIWPQSPPIIIWEE